MVGRYFLIGVGLIGFGVVLALPAYFLISSVPITALGIASAILGITAATLPEQPIAGSAVRAMVRGSTLTLEEVLEEFQVEGKAIYMPPRDERVFAFVPTRDGDAPVNIELLREAPVRLLSRVGGEAGLMVLPPAAEVVRAMPLGESPALEESLTRLVVEATELCASVKAVEQPNSVIVEMRGIKVKTESPRFARSMGSIPASAAACVIATVKGRAATITEEKVEGASERVVFSLLGDAGKVAKAAGLEAQAR